MIYNENIDKFQVLDNSQVLDFFKDIQDYKFSIFNDINLFEKFTSNRCFFDIDLVWNATKNREVLYAQLKGCNYKIFNFIYDLVPILFPNYLRENTKKNFANFLKTVYKYSDSVFLDSLSAQDDFTNLKIKANISRYIQTNVVYLGSDFSVNSLKIDTHRYDNILSKKYILFVATIEPRKQHKQLLSAFEELYKTNQDLNVVLIGKVGWKVEEFEEYLQKHPLKDKNIFHFTNVDDNELKLFYENAFLVTYLSKYEGYGLPIAESLQYSNITIVSQNSSMKEVGFGFTDYVKTDKKEELIDLISKYLDDEKLYNEKREYIKSNYVVQTWDEFFSTIIKLFNNKCYNDKILGESE